MKTKKNRNEEVKGFLYLHMIKQLEERVAALEAQRVELERKCWAAGENIAPEREKFDGEVAELLKSASPKDSGAIRKLLNKPR